MCGGRKGGWGGEKVWVNIGGERRGEHTKMYKIMQVIQTLL